MSFSQPIKGAIAANIRRIMKLRMESTVALMSAKSHLVDVSFEDGGGKTAEDIKDEQDGKAGVRKVESQGDISADYKNEDQDSPSYADRSSCPPGRTRERRSRPSDSVPSK